MAQKPIMLYTSPTPNGHAITIFLEELKAVYPGFDYEFRSIDITKNTQKEDWFIKLNPNGRIPVITDRAHNNFNVFETSAILLYLAQHYDPEFRFCFEPNKNPEDYSEMVQWLFFAHGGIGPMQGQAAHFIHYALEDIPYGKKRYTDETKRLYGVLDIRLKDRDWLAGSGRGKFSLAEMKTYPWVRSHTYIGIETLDEFPNVKAWVDRIKSRPGTEAGIQIPRTKG